MLLRMLPGLSNNGRFTDDEQPLEIAISLLGDAAEPLLATPDLHGLSRTAPFMPITYASAPYIGAASGSFSPAEIRKDGARASKRNFEWCTASSAVTSGDSGTKRRRYRNR
jgi:hypothetical protein